MTESPVPRDLGTETSRVLTEVRTVLNRARDGLEMVTALKQVVSLLEKWERTDRPRRTRR